MVVAAESRLTVPHGRRIVVFGDVFDDILAVPHVPIRTDTDTPSSIRHLAGGSAANVAAWLGVAGSAVDFVGMVGAADVERHGALLADAGAVPHLLGHPTLPTGAIVVIVDGQNRTMLTEGGANAALGPDDVSDDLLETAALIHFSGYSIFGRVDPAPFRRLIERAGVRGVEISVDPGSAGFLADHGAERFLETIAGASILLPNLEEGRLLTGLEGPAEIVTALCERFAVVALTLGEAGAVVACRGEIPEHTGAIDTAIIDPTGAGDAFSAGFLASWIVDRDAATAADAGVRLAARAVAALGGRPQLR